MVVKENTMFKNYAKNKWMRDVLEDILGNCVTYFQWNYWNCTYACSMTPDLSLEVGVCEHGIRMIVGLKNGSFLRDGWAQVFCMRLEGRYNTEEEYWYRDFAIVERETIRETIGRIILITNVIG